MSYHTKINEVQMFGNNECYPEWIEFIKTQGIKVDKEFHYKGEIKDFMGALKTIEAITMNIHNARERRIEEIQQTRCIKDLRGIFDFTNIPKELDDEKSDEFSTSLFDKTKDIVEHGYAFMSYHFFKICEPCLELTDTFSGNKHLYCYKIKDDCKIKIEAN